MLDGLRGGSPSSPSLSPNLALSSSPSKALSNPFARSSPLASSSGFPSGGARDDYTDDDSDASSSRAHSPRPGGGGGGRNADDDGAESPSVPTALNDALAAFGSAGARRADGRRGGLADQGFDVPSSRRGPGAGSQPSSPELDRASGPGNAARQKAAQARRLDPNEYPDTPAFREVDEALRRVRDEWPALVRGTSLAGQLGEGDGGETDDDAAGGEFDPVSLALHLLDPARAGENGAGGGGRGGEARQTLPSFLRLKQQLDHAIRSTLSPVANPTSSNTNPYRAYETAISSHNLTLQSLSGAQKHIAGLRNGLGGTRERLEGKGREGLAGMYARMGMLEEMAAVLDEMCDAFFSLFFVPFLTFSPSFPSPPLPSSHSSHSSRFLPLPPRPLTPHSDTLLRLPPSLETLLSEKRFLSAVVLLVRSIKALNKPELVEIGALADLRAWAGAQEGVCCSPFLPLHPSFPLLPLLSSLRFRLPSGRRERALTSACAALQVVLEILIEELHNHLYLKSFYCDVRWKSYTRGQMSRAFLSSFSFLRPPVSSMQWVLIGGTTCSPPRRLWRRRRPCFLPVNLLRPHPSDLHPLLRPLDRAPAPAQQAPALPAEPRPKAVRLRPNAGRGGRGLGLARDAAG